jgi:hypothetical protein
MNIRHLSDEELEYWLAGDQLPSELATHASECLLCRRRRSAFDALVEAAMLPDPSQAERARVRAKALDHAVLETRHSWTPWALAVAALVVLIVLPVIRWSGNPPTQPFNPDAVLSEVDQVLDRDPLAALAPSEILDEIAPLEADENERNVS